jgi:hypothetical protein
MAAALSSDGFAIVDVAPGRKHVMTVPRYHMRVLERCKQPLDAIFQRRASSCRRLSAWCCVLLAQAPRGAPGTSSDIVCTRAKSGGARSTAAIDTGA